MRDEDSGTLCGLLSLWGYLILSEVETLPDGLWSRLESLDIKVKTCKKNGGGVEDA